jgi:sialidase-1
MHHYLISKDPAIYQAFPDLVLTGTGRLICIFSECTHHLDRSWSHIAYRTSDDRGRTWSDKHSLVTPSIKSETGYFWNCPRIFNLKDGRLAIVCDRPASEYKGAVQPNFLWLSEDDGENWTGPLSLPASGIVPDKIVQSQSPDGRVRWHLSAHLKSEGTNSERWQVRTWISDNGSSSWDGPFLIAEVPGLKLCEVSLLPLPSGEIVAFLRENSFAGRDAYKCISRDGGKTWTAPVEFPLPCCHRPVAGLLQSGKILITFRLCHGGKSWVGQNFMAALTDIESCLAETRSEARARIIPIAYDRSPHPDIGYSGWVQFPDGEIHMAYYLVDDHARGHIRGCSCREEDFVLPTG